MATFFSVVYAQVGLENMLNPVYDFVRRLQSSSNEFSETLMEIVQELKPLLPYMPREVCSQIPTSMVCLESMGNIAVDNNFCL